MDIFYEYCVVKLFFCLVFASIFLGGCTGKVRHFACTGQNWAEFGYKTGAKGQSIYEFDTHKSSCSANLERVAAKAYLDGYTRGIVEYCTFDNGYALGHERMPESKNCPSALEPAFAKGYAAGKRDIEDKVRRIDKAINTRPRSGFRM